MATTPTPIDAGQVASDMANSVGGEVVSTALDVWPALVVPLLALAVISGVAGKFGLKKKRSVI